MKYKLTYKLAFFLFQYHSLQSLLLYTMHPKAVFKSIAIITMLLALFSCTVRTVDAKDDMLIQSKLCSVRESLSCGQCQTAFSQDPIDDETIAHLCDSNKVDDKVCLHFLFLSRCVSVFFPHLYMFFYFERLIFLSNRPVTP